MKRSLRTRLIGHFQENLSLYTFSIALTLMGIIFGAIIVNSLPESSSSNLNHYLSQFFTEMGKGNVVGSVPLFNETFLHGSQYLGFIWVLGLSIIGFPIILILLFLKGVVVGFTVGFLVSQMGLHGFWMALASVFPQNLLLIPAFILVSTQAVIFSLKMIRQLLMKTRKTPLLPQFGNYGLLMLSMLSLLVVSSLFQAYVSPVLMKSIIHS